LWVAYKDTEFDTSRINEIPKVPRGTGQHPKTNNPKSTERIKAHIGSQDRSILLSSDKCKRKPYG